MILEESPSNKDLLTTKEHRYSDKKEVCLHPASLAPLFYELHCLWGGELVTDACILVTKMWRTAGKGSEQKLELENKCLWSQWKLCRIIKFSTIIVLMSVFQSQFSKLFYIEAYLWGKCSFNSMKNAFIKSFQSLKIQHSCSKHLVNTYFITGIMLETRNAKMNTILQSVRGNKQLT